MWENLFTAFSLSLSLSLSFSPSSRFSLSRDAAMEKSLFVYSRATSSHFHRIYSFSIRDRWIPQLSLHIAACDICDLIIAAICGENLQF
jgi:hypothetical protein